MSAIPSTPLSSSPDYETPSSSDKDIVWVEFEENDNDDPVQWPSHRKLAISGTLTFFTFMAAFVGSSFAIGSSSIEADLKCSHELSVLGLVIFFAAFGIAPLVLAPLSEIYGRTPMYRVASVLWLIFIAVTAVGRNIQTVIVSRFIQGCSASTGATLVGGSLTELYEPKYRGKPMSLFAFAAFSGTGAGPLLMGYVAQNRSWRYIQYIQLAMVGVCVVGIFVFVRETRVPVILKKRAALRRAESGLSNYRSRGELEHKSFLVMLRVSLFRPLRLLTTEPVLFASSVWVGWAWGCMFLTLEAVPLVYQEVYGFNVGETGVAFVTLVIGSFLGFATNPIQERLYHKYHGYFGPESRLMVACGGSFLVPIGIIIFGFCQGRTHWMGPSAGLAIMIAGTYTIYIACFVYLADNYKIFASSALAGQSLCRNLFGTAIPLFAVQLYRGLGFQWASFLAAMLSLGLALTPFALMKYGPALRERSKVVMQLNNL